MADLSWLPPIGKRYDGGYALVEREHVLAYAAATGDTSFASRGDDAVAPPMFHVRLLRDLMFAFIGDPELGLDLLRLVHGEHDAVFFRPLRVGERVHLQAVLDKVQQKARGLLVEGRLQVLVGEELAVEARSAFFVRGQTKMPVSPASPAGVRPAHPQTPPGLELPWRVGEDQSHRYALASLDDNPIHVDPATARAAGLPDVILQGLCTMAMTGAGLVRSLADDDSRRLRRLAVRFSRPVFNAEALRTRAWKVDDAYVFDVLNAAGDAVITGGRAELR